ncbi:MAG: hypothetical protein AB7O64_03625 [Methylibium sp.]
MSTLAYAQLTNAREAATPGTSTSTGKPGIQTYVDAFTALVPAEVLTLHALVISVTTEIPKAAAAGATAAASAASSASAAASRIIPEAVETLAFSFWGLVVASAALYAAPRLMGGHWDRFDWVRVLIAPFAFVGWTMLQRTTAFDAAFPDLQQAPRTVIALFLGATLGAITAALAQQADKKPSTAR